LPMTRLLEALGTTGIVVHACYRVVLFILLLTRPRDWRQVSRLFTMQGVLVV